MKQCDHVRVSEQNIASDTCWRLLNTEKVMSCNPEASCLISIGVRQQVLMQNTMFNIYPKVDTWACRAMDIAGGGGPTAQQSRRHLLGSDPELTLVGDCTPDVHQLDCLTKLLYTAGCSMLLMRCCCNLPMTS